MTVPAENGPMIIPLNQWPATDQAAWAAGLVPGDILDGHSYAHSLRPTTLRNSARGYGRWLAVLTECDVDALLLAPVERVTPDRLRIFLGVLRAAGNTNNTIKARMWELRSALRVIAPEADFRWLNYPAGNSLEMLLPTKLTVKEIVDIRLLQQWGTDDMAEALTMAPSSSRAILYRNGLLVALFACRAPRIASMASIHIEQGLTRSDGGYRMAFTAAQTKGKRRLSYDVTPALTPSIDHYLAVERPSLLNGKCHSWLWVNEHGDPLRLRGIEGIIRRGSQGRFGKVMGSHRFRHSLATSSMIADPSTPGRIAAVLGNSPAVTEACYALGGQLEAGQQFLTDLEAERAETAAMGRIFYG